MSNSGAFKMAMVIDDNAIDLYISEFILTECHFASEVILMNSARKALDYLRSSVTTPEILPDFIFLDVRMPEIDGFEFLEQYSLLPEVIKKNCIIMMLSSSLDSHDHKQAAGNQYVNGFLGKPLNMKVLKELESGKFLCEPHLLPVDFDQSVMV